MNGHPGLRGLQDETSGAPARAADDPRLRLQQFLTGRSRGVTDARWLLGQALPRFSGDPEARLVVEELVDHLGRLMQFEAARDHDSGFSVWSSVTGSQMVVSAMDTVEAVVSFGRISRAYDELRASGRLRSDRRTSTLGVICGEVRFRPLEQALDLRRHSEPVRLVSLDALLALAVAHEAGTVSHALAAGLLEPSTFADPLVALVATGAPRRPAGGG